MAKSKQPRFRRLKAFGTAFCLTLCLLGMGAGFLVADYNTRKVTFGAAEARRAIPAPGAGPDGADRGRGGLGRQGVDHTPRPMAGGRLADGGGTGFRAQLSGYGQPGAGEGEASIQHHRPAV